MSQHTSTTVARDAVAPPPGAEAETGQRRILGIDVLVADQAAAVARIAANIAARRYQPVAFLNAHGCNIAHRSEPFRSVLATFDVLADGIGLDTASRLLYDAPFPNNLNGTDFIPYLLGELKEPLVVGLFGAAPGVARAAAAALSRDAPHHTFRALGDGYMDSAHTARMLQDLEEQPVDILLVALGNPAQELWIAENVGPAHATVPIGVGAFFDFITGRVPRAPRWMIDARVEWMFRLSLEPGRMWRRYILGNPAFLLRVLKQRSTRRRNR